jgi:cell wall-associated NlpC family hydrolase
VKKSTTAGIAGFGCIGPMLISGMFAGFLGIGVLASSQSTGDNTAICDGESLSVTINGDLPEDGIAGYSKEGLERAAAIVAVGEKHDIPAKGQLVALMTAMQESTLGDNPSTTSPDENHDAGLFQQRVLPGWYGTVDQVNDPAQAAEWFYLGRTVEKEVDGGAGPKGYHIPGLVDIKGWEDLPATVAAQRVQVSAFPDAYAKHEPAAREILSYLSGVDITLDESEAGAGTCDGGDVATGDTASVIETAKKTLGTNYILGAGGPDGPTRGSQDCSGLTSYAYAKAYGITLPRTARGQWAALRSHEVSVNDIQPGDLIFEAWGSRLGPGVVSHVMIYIGDGKIIEASRSAGTTRISTARLSGYAFVGIARVPKDYKE